MRNAAVPPDACAISFASVPAKLPISVSPASKRIQQCAVVPCESSRSSGTTGASLTVSVSFEEEESGRVEVGIPLPVQPPSVKRSRRIEQSARRLP